MKSKFSEEKIALIEEINNLIMPELKQKVNIEIEKDIVGAIVVEAFPKIFLSMRFKELLDEPLKDWRYDIPNAKIEDIWGYTAYDYGSVVEQIIEEIVDEELQNFIEQCHKEKKYSNYFSENLVTDSDEDDYWYSIIELTSDLYSEYFFIERQQLELFEKNPTIKEIFDKYASGVEKYWMAREQWEERYSNWLKETREKAKKILNPNIEYKITKNDKEILQKLKQEYTKTELKLLIWTGILQVSNSIAAEYPNPQYPEKSPNLEDYLN